MKPTLRLTFIAAAILGFTPITRAAEIPSAAPATKPSTQPSNRSKEDLMAEINATGKELGGIIKSPDTFTNAKKRAEIAPKAIPVMKKFVAAFEELATKDPMAKSQSDSLHSQFLSMMATFGDADAEKQLTALAKGDDKGAGEAKAALMLSKWWRGSEDAAAQEKLLDDARALMKANPKDDKVAMTLMQMSQQGAATPALKESVDKILMEEAQGPQASGIVESLKAAAKMKSLENKPLTISGQKNDGSQFTTADWKGKVILVDFWATWCGPCLQELPRVKKAYADFHEKGLEIVGVSCDRDGSALSTFLADNKDMPWPQLFDEKTKGWHPIATGFGINGIPTMFLIDKKGTLRSVTARENFEEMIPKLLAE